MTSRGNPRNFYDGKRVFVTGHRGFVGTHLAKQLRSLKAEVIGYDIQDECDVRSPHRLAVEMLRAAPDLVFHLAAQAFVPVGFREPAETFATNAQGTVNLIEAARALRSAPPIVVVTTDKVYGGGLGVSVEGDPLIPRCPYSASKIAAEHAAQVYHETFGLRIATARAGNIIGAGDWGEGRLIPNAARALRVGRLVPVYNPNAIRPWQHVDDVIDGYLLLGERLAADPTFAGAWNFGPRKHHTVQEVVERVIAAWGSGSWTIVKTELHEVDELRISSLRSRISLGWEPAIDFDEMIETTVRWYKDHV